MKPIPVADELSHAYWDGARRHQLTVQRCGRCGKWTHYPRPACAACGSTELVPTAVSGRGTVYTWTVSHYVGGPGFDSAVPYAIVLVQLDEDATLRIVANLRDCPPDRIRAGMPVEVVFEDLGDGVALPQFRPRTV